MSEAFEVLNTVFGHDSFRGSQENVIENVVDGQDVIYITSTGGGKSACYQIPSIIRDGVGIIISPLMALMKDQVDFLQFNNVAAETINSSVKGYDRQNIMTAIKNDEIDLLYVTPEMLAQPRFLEFLSEVNIALFGIDEAHAASQWGHDFRPDYKALSMLPKHFPDVPRIAVTATADPQTLNDIKSTLGLEDAVIFEGDIDRKNISMHIEMRKSAKSQQQKMLEIINERAGESGLIYCVGKKSVDRVANWLVEQGISALPYHAGYSATDRERNQDEFLDGNVDILVCTVAFGMGVDKSDIRYVIHNDMPSSVEAYQQEIGRAGRDGQPAYAYMFTGNADINIRKRMIKKSRSGAPSKRTDNNKLDMMIALSETLYCRRKTILNYFGKNMKEDCGNCDNCNKKSQGLNVSKEARDICNWLYDNPSTEDTYSIAQKASTISTANKHSKERWSLIIRQMIINGLIDINHSNCGRLQIGKVGRDFIEAGDLIIPSQVTMTSAKFVKSAPAKPNRTVQKTRTSGVKNKPQKTDRSLLSRLTTVRNTIAREEKVPRHYVLHNSALEEMADQLPLTKSELLGIKGIGHIKASSYAHRLIPIIEQYAA
jgi:ATP-dependent DNA helicase RecQ